MLAYLIIIILLIIISFIIYKLCKYKTDYVKSSINEDIFLVRDLPDKQNASNILALIKHRTQILINYLYENKNTHPQYELYINNLYDKFKNIKIVENDDDILYTSYSINKGDELVLCLRSKYIKGHIHDINLLMYVVLHEISHIACPEYGHTELFKEIFLYITTISININLYKRIDFSKNNKEYCGMMITDSII
jgi:hypothetical protein